MDQRPPAKPSSHRAGWVLAGIVAIGAILALAVLIFSHHDVIQPSAQIKPNQSDVTTSR